MTFLLSDISICARTAEKNSMREICYKLQNKRKEDENVWNFWKLLNFFTRRLLWKRYMLVIGKWFVFIFLMIFPRFSYIQERCGFLQIYIKHNFVNIKSQTVKINISSKKLIDNVIMDKRNLSWAHKFMTNLISVVDMNKGAFNF